MLAKTVGIKPINVFLDSISFPNGVGKEQGWKGLSMPLPFTIQMGTTKYNFTIKNISPEVCASYGRRKCCWKPYSPEVVCGCKQYPPERKNQPKFGTKDLLASMQQNARNAAASEEADATAHNDEELASSPAAVEVAEGSAAESAVEGKAKGQVASPKGAARIGPLPKKDVSPLGPAIKKVLQRKKHPKAKSLKDRSMTIACAKVGPHKSAIWDSTLGYPGEGPGTPSALVTATQNMNGSLTGNAWNLLEHRLPSKPTR